MEIKNVMVGELETNCYLLNQNGNMLIIDPGAEIDVIKKAIANNKVIGILITHHHFDHVGAVEELKKEYAVNVYDIHNLEEGTNTIGNFTFEVIKTPGHKEDCITYYFKEENSMFVGDFIFEGTIGRTDLPGGNLKKMKQSIIKILQYNLDNVVYPGHGPKTTLKQEEEQLRSLLLYS